ncbi:MAG: UTP--glucose-phosphate uridylyltransferase [Actinomycetota bacterium]|nr:UTP--glucose-phosphate uridylyltransferase [Actinomycetota bacterium]
MNSTDAPCPAVITAAGHATRFAPFSRYCAKEMLPLGCEPALGHVIGECLAAGADPVYVITRPDDTQVGAYCADLHRRGLPVTAIPEDTSHGYGNAAGLLTVADRLREHDTFLVAFGDDLLLTDTPGRDLATMRCHAQDTGASVIAAQLVPHHDIGGFGVLDTTGPGTDRVIGIRQRPHPDTVAEPLALVSRLALHPDILTLLRPRKDARDEIDLGLAADELSRVTPVEAHRLRAKWVTVGAPEQFHHALNAYWAQPAEHRDAATAPLHPAKDTTC